MANELIIRKGEFEKAITVFKELAKQFDFTKKQEVIISYDPCKETRIVFRKFE